MFFLLDVLFATEELGGKTIFKSDKKAWCAYQNSKVFAVVSFIRLLKYFRIIVE
jgi:hypothetical protein